MRVSHLTLLISLMSGCNTCRDDCDDQYQDCLDEGRPTAVCESEKRDCIDECEKKDDSHDDDGQLNDQQGSITQKTSP